MGHKLVSAIVEGIGENAVLSQQEGKKVITREQITAHDYEEATYRALEWLDSQIHAYVIPTVSGLMIAHSAISYR